MTSTSLDQAANEAVFGNPEVDGRRRRRGRLTLALLALVCVAPVLASYLAYYVWPPGGRVNHGALLTPAPLPEAVLPGMAGQPALDREDLRGHWTLLYVGTGACGGPCEAALYTMRQARLAQADEMERVERVWLVTDAERPPASVLERHDGLRVAQAADAWLAQLPGATAGAHIFLVDPLGNVMMRFPDPADPKGVLRDLQRLLKYSPLGRG